MKYQRRVSSIPLTYSKISLDKRMELVQLVVKNYLSISKACKILQIRTSTAKLIIKKYRENGTFFEKKSDRQARLTNIRENQKLLFEQVHLPNARKIEEIQQRSYQAQAINQAISTTDNNVIYISNQVKVLYWTYHLLNEASYLNMAPFFNLYIYS